MTGQHSQIECENVQSLLPEFALGTLERDLAESVHRHVEICQPCRRELGAYRRVTDALLLSPAPVEPSPSLRNRVMMAAGIQPRQTRQQRARLWSQITGIFQPSPRLLRLSPAIIALALVFSLALAYQSMQLRTELEQARMENTTLQTELASQGQDISDVFRPDVVAWELTGTESAPTARAKLYCNPDSRTAFLTAADLPPLPEGQVYQLWLIQDGVRESGGLLTVDHRGKGVLKVKAPQPFSTYRAVGMTVEPQGGSAGPTGPRVLAGQLY